MKHEHEIKEMKDDIEHIVIECEKMLFECAHSEVNYALLVHELKDEVIMLKFETDGFEEDSSC